ncbi:hypothetical protein ZOSMA_36G00150 [Zostera marina]|uniref:Uncharacterized protein n=1 Tax=Zostera marina TaxID=29655 RepID=A0A0K9P5W8_ZOSMR|nr:hypothetical protein ZOSMA_36G00150 [Zostera marina]
MGDIVSFSILQNRSFSPKVDKFPEYEMPTVTWGVIQGRKEKLVSRVIITDYLKFRNKFGELSSPISKSGNGGLASILPWIGNCRVDERLSARWRRNGKGRT